MSTLNNIRMNNAARRSAAYTEALRQYRLAKEAINEEEYAVIRNVLEETRDTPKTAAEIARTTGLSVQEIAQNLCAMNAGWSRYQNKIPGVLEEKNPRESEYSYTTRIKKNDLPRVEIHQKKVVRKFAEIDEQTGKIIDNGRTFTMKETKNLYQYIK